MNKPQTMRRKDLPPAARRRRILRVVASSDPSAIGREIELDGAELTVGRATSGPGHIDDEWLSREHARIFRSSGGPQDLIEDLRTRNGTFLNGAPLKRPEILQTGAVIAVGETALVVEQEPDADALPTGPGVDDGLVPELIGTSLGAKRLRRSIATVARAEGNVVLLGQTGTGKEVAAAAVHRLSGRKGPFVPVNCAAIPAETAELEFFGSTAGAFTDAKDRDGFFVQAHGGTLFLDEIGELPGPLQAKMLRVLEDGVVQPLGAGPRRKIDVRVVCATHVDLVTSSFRRDLLARLGDWTLRIPPLADRRADVLTLWRHFTSADPRHGDPMSFAAAEALLLHGWPANIRELQKLARRVVALSGPDAWIDLDALPEAMQAAIRDRARPEAAPHVSDDPDATLDPNEIQPARLDALLRAPRGNISMVARATGLWREQLYRLSKRYGLKPGDYR